MGGIVLKLGLGLLPWAVYRWLFFVHADEHQDRDRQDEIDDWTCLFCIDPLIQYCHGATAHSG